MPIVPQTKKCSRCKQDKPATTDEFYTQRRNRDGLYGQCKECVRKASRQWRSDNPVRAMEANREWCAKNPEHTREVWRRNKARWRENPKNAKKDIEVSKRWARENPDKHNAVTQRRAARRRGNGGSYTAKEWQDLCAQYDYRCLCCGECKTLTPDHIVPVSKGGTSYISNIQPLCLSCNHKKHAKHIDYRY